MKSNQQASVMIPISYAVIGKAFQKAIRTPKPRDLFDFIKCYPNGQSVSIVLKWNKAFLGIPLFPVKRSHQLSVVEADDGMVAGSHEASPFLSSMS